MPLAEALETTRPHRVAGLTGDRTALVTTRPCRAPHQTISEVGLIGGGQVPMPGEGSRAHHGVLFLDELPEFRYVLEALRQWSVRESPPRIWTCNGSWPNGMKLGHNLCIDKALYGFQGKRVWTVIASCV
jgi:Magnesium chelatase, subunit ChlI